MAHARLITDFFTFFTCCDASFITGVTLKVDGGACANNFLMQFQADMLRVPIDRPKLVETTAFGAAFLAGIASGVWESVDDIALLRQSDRIFKPEMDAEQAKQYHDNWLRAVGRAEKWSQE